MLEEREVSEELNKKNNYLFAFFRRLNISIQQKSAET